VRAGIYGEPKESSTQITADATGVMFQHARSADVGAVRAAITRCEFGQPCRVHVVPICFAARRNIPHLISVPLVFSSGGDNRPGQRGASARGERRGGCFRGASTTQSILVMACCHASP
jgi:hypothetical protein